MIHNEEHVYALEWLQVSTWVGASTSGNYSFYNK